jgi:hypothetical protein
MTESQSLILAAVRLKTQARRARDEAQRLLSKAEDHLVAATAALEFLASKEPA